jgi:hypothetical protein
VRRHDAVEAGQLATLRQVDTEAGGTRQWARGERDADDLAVAGTGLRGGRVAGAEGGKRLAADILVYEFLGR